MIPYGKQNISQSDVDAVVQVLNSDFLTQGPMVPKFEEAIADACGVSYSVAANSATSALHIACLALGVGPGDIVWTSAITFVASANCALYCGATVDFVDIDKETYNMSIDALESKLRRAARDGNLPKVLIPVHLTGQSCDMEEISRLSKTFGFSVIEDASHAVGATFCDVPVGSCEYSDISVFSFHPVKIITTGEGGVATCKSEEIANRMRLYRSHGITRDEGQMMNPTVGPWHYEQLQLGYNYRMTDIQAALGVNQLLSLPAFIDKRHEVAQRYKLLLSELPIKLPAQDPRTRSSFHLYVVRIDFSSFKTTQRVFFEEMRHLGVGVNLHYSPVYTQPYFKSLGFEAGYCKEAEHYYRQSVSLPIHPLLTTSEQDYVVEAIMKSLRMRG